MDPVVVADGIRAELAAFGTAERAAGAKKYLKSDLEFLGVRMPDWRHVLKGWLKDRPELTRRQLLAVVRELWRRPVFELRSFGVGLLEEGVGVLA
ncbi:MAG: hypothetical protein EP299_03495, partial [Acidobacteria bacterium]